MRRNSDFPWQDFDPDSYFEHNYRILRVEDRHILATLREFFANANVDRRHGVDIGPGSNLYPALAMLPFCDSVELIEPSSSARQWLKQELGTPASRWGDCWSVLRENSAYQRYDPPWARMAGSVQVTEGTVFELPEQKWDIGTMFFVAESVTPLHYEFYVAVNRFLRSLQPGAPFSIGFMENSVGYRVGHRDYPACPVGHDEVSAYLSNLADCNTIRIDIHGEPLRAGYSGMLLTLGRTRTDAAPPSTWEDVHSTSIDPAQPFGVTEGRFRTSARVDTTPIALTGVVEPPPPLRADLSVELAHFSEIDFRGGVAAMAIKLRHSPARIKMSSESLSLQDCSTGAPVISTCLLIDDYFLNVGSPSTVIPMLLRAADESGVEIDYIARESGCARSGSVPIARLLEELLAASAAEAEKLRDPKARRSSTKRHGRTRTRRRTDWTFSWSCPFLAAIWQLLRLGALGDLGAGVGQPIDWCGRPLPRYWWELPPVVRLRTDAAPFIADRTLSLLSTAYAGVEEEAQVLLERLALTLPALRRDPEKSNWPLDRISYAISTDF
ncbi:SCO2525 family SAM-dependent methyltransferase [Cryptosporangium sp. NPDC048952]|uniref:SCO2525 family SAM-dependent methyltransferase n=1 Tax=Cryptosporangium sp. NPDC048952 TaxID=3363961 RepID=UPI003723A3B0